MSYARFGELDSDVYVFEAGTGYVCCGCALEGPAWGQWFEVETPQEMVDHLLEHRAAGHVVPDHALEELRGEAEGIVSRKTQARGLPPGVLGGEG